jgi:hypothetical protein
LEGDPLLKKSAPIELIVNPTIRSATAPGTDLTSPPITSLQDRGALNSFQDC